MWKFWLGCIVVSWKENREGLMSWVGYFVESFSMVIGCVGEVVVY